MIMGKICTRACFNHR